MGGYYNNGGFETTTNTNEIITDYSQNQQNNGGYYNNGGIETTTTTTTNEMITDYSQNQQSNGGYGMGETVTYGGTETGGTVQTYGAEGLQVINQTSPDQIPTYTGEVPAGVAGHSATFVVKASYSNYNALSSGGVEVTVDASSVKYDFDIKLDSNNVTSTGSYTDSGVKVYSNSKDVTSSCDSIVTYVDGKEVNGTVKITAPGEHNIVYKVTYKGSQKEATKHVTIK